MVFSNIFFLFFFLPIVLGIYYISKEKYRNNILLVASLCFYAYGEPKFVFVMMVSIMCNYIFGLVISRVNRKAHKKIWLIISIAANVTLLFIYKYIDFTIGMANTLFKTNIPYVGLILPIGISFFTFQSMSYVIDVYRNSSLVQKNPMNVALYIALFPQLIAGPIVRYSTIAKQIETRTIVLDDFGYGVKRFISGFAKKVIIANNLSIVAEQVFNTTDFLTTSILYSWIGSLCFSLQIFYDFSGYSDMAIGLGKMFGFDFEENFYYPYVSKSITEFWRRWHISLSSWFRDYVYIPLGGSKKGVLRNVMNLFIVWMLTGIWHGANYTFIIWGFTYFAMLLFEKFIIHPDKLAIYFKYIWMLLTLLIVNFEWVIFNSETLSSAYHFILSMMGYYSNNIGFRDAQCILLIREYGIYMILGVVLSTPIVPAISQLIYKYWKTSTIYNVVSPFYYIGLMLWSMSYLILGAHNPFIYFNF